MTDAVSRCVVPALLAGICFLFGGVPGGASIAAADDRSEALRWVKDSAVASAGAGPIESPSRDADLRALGQLAGRARVIAFGEAAHGSHEFLSFRNRLFAYLVRHRGVTALAAETGFAESVAVDDYVLGRGSLTPELVAAVFSFAAPAAYRENYELIEWMRAYNAVPNVTRKIRFYGLEMMGRMAATGQPYARKAFDAALSYMTMVDAEGAQRLSTRLAPLLDKLTARGYESLDEAERDSLTLAVADLVRVYERRHIQWVAASDSISYHRGLRNALNARNLDADLRIGGWWIRRTGDRDQRDASSAESVRWALEREGPQGRVFVFAHNVHVRKGMQPLPEKSFISLGQHLRESLGDDYFVIGSVHDDAAADPESLNRLLDEAGLAAFVLDLRWLRADTAAGRWWNVERTVHQQGQRYVLDPTESFDALWFTSGAGPHR